MRRDRRLRERTISPTKNTPLSTSTDLILDRTSRLAEQIEKRDERRKVEHVA
jgi:hypothetical protein